MTYLFFAIAAAMILVALGFVLVPLLRRGRQAGRPRGVFVLSLVLAFVVPLATVGLYALIGTPAAIDPAVRAQPKLTVEQAIAQLSQHLKTSPDDLQGWVLLAQTHSAMGDPAGARDAYDHALKLAPDNADVMVAWAEADSLARPDHRIEGKSRSLLEKAVKANPRNQRGLWLLGISQYQRGRFADAALTWRRLQVLLDPAGKVAGAVQRQIAMANARAAGKSQAEAVAMLSSGAPAAAGSAASNVAGADKPAAARLEVKVSVAPDLRKNIDASSSLFVYARAAKGSPMPLAVVRLKASQLPTTVTLTDGMGMTPTMQLSSADKVLVVARISKSGQAAPEKGDLEGTTGPLAVHAPTSVDVVIDHLR